MDQKTSDVAPSSNGLPEQVAHLLTLYYTLQLLSNDLHRYAAQMHRYQTMPWYERFSEHKPQLPTWLRESLLVKSGQSMLQIQLRECIHRLSSAGFRLVPNEGNCDFPLMWASSDGIVHADYLITALQTRTMATASEQAR